MKEEAIPFLIAEGLSLVLGGILLYYYLRARKLLDVMWAVDTYTAKELRTMCSDDFNATVEVQGQASCDRPILSLVSQIPCCWCRTRVDLQEVRNRATKSGIQTEHVWVNALDRTDVAVFSVTDETGYTFVDPTNSEIDAEEPHVIITSQREPWFGSIGYSDTGNYRITEEIFIPTGYIYVLGQASACQEGTSTDVLVHYPGEGYIDPGKPIFIISRKSERELAQSQEITAKICLWIGIAAAISFVFCAWVLFGVIHWRP